MSYEDYYIAKSLLENLMPDKRDIARDGVPEEIRLKASELRLMILGALAEINETGWEDDE